jgi:predicted AAA+ superfamily ATPase
VSLQDTIEALVAESDATRLPRPSPREARLPALPGKADALIGMRRAGKTWRMYQEIHDQLDAGAGPGQLLYLNFEDERLPEVEGADLHRFVDAWRRRHPDAIGKPLNLYLDEVQNVPGWESFVRRMLDRGDTRVVVTGSSAQLLSREIATSLRGRALPTEIAPFSFREALTFRGEELPEAWPVSSDRGSLLHARFAAYLRSGGFPEVQDLDDRTRVRVLQDYVDVVVLRDVIERHSVSNVEALRYLVRRLLSDPAGRFSINRFYNALKSQGRKVSKDSLYAALAHIEDAFLVFTLPIDHRSEAVRSANPRKAYPVDPGLAVAHSFSAARNTGHLLETAVYLELRRRGYTCGYVKTGSGFEVDFAARRRGLGDELLVQVCADATEPGTRDRELRALDEAMKERKLGEGLLLTMGETDTVEVGAGTVTIRPTWRWLLEPEDGARDVSPRGAPGTGPPAS